MRYARNDRTAQRDMVEIGAVAHANAPDYHNRNSRGCRIPMHGNVEADGAVHTSVDNHNNWAGWLGVVGTMARAGCAWSVDVSNEDTAVELGPVVLVGLVDVAEWEQADQALLR